MAEISISPLVETEDFNAASLNNRFRVGTGSFEGAINDLVADALAPGALNHNHLPTIVHYSGVIKFGRLGSGSTYIITQCDGGAGGTPQWVPVDSSGSSGGGTDLELDLGTNYNLTGTTIQGVLVMAEIQVSRLYRSSGAGTDPNHYAKFMIQAWNGAAWQSLTRTVRWISAAISGGVAVAQGRNQVITVPIRTLIRASDMGNNTIRKVRVVVSIGNQDPAGTNTDLTLKLWGCQLAAVALQSTRT